MTPERFQRIKAVLNKRQPDLTVITDEVHKGRNLSAIIRTCDAVGIDQIHVVLPKEGFRHYGGTAASADKWGCVQHHHDVLEPVRDLQGQGYQVVAANLCDSAKDFRALDYTRPTALLMGAEIRGVSEGAVTCVDHNIVIPMSGMVESFNVSVACAIVLMEAQRQRQMAGMYNQRRLPEALYRKRYIHWAHPVIAHYCDEHQIAYPPITDDGEIENISAWYASVRR